MQNNRFGTAFLVLSMLVSLISITAEAQVNAVVFGRNRIQYKKYDWKFYQTDHFNTYTHQNGLELGKFVAQVAEEELPNIEAQIEATLGRKASIIVYNSYEDYKASNLGLGNSELPTNGGVTKLVNNKLAVWFDGDHAHLRTQIREGIARVLTDNVLFGDDLGEIASNAALLDLPKWLTDGFVSYHGERWNTSWDDQLRNAMLADEYRNFYAFAFAKPILAGHAFWWYIDERYKPENVTYFLYLARLYKNLNSASQKVAKKKFKFLLQDFMEYQQNKYQQDIRRRKNAPRGRLSVVEEVGKKDFIRFQANPNPRSNNYAYVEFKQGIYSVKLVENYEDARTLVKFGVRTQQGDINPNYPILAWDNKGSRVLVIYNKENKIQLFVYDLVARLKRFSHVVKGVDQILDAQFMLDANTLIFSAVKNGHTDLFQYKIEQEKLTPLTNDVYDDIDPTFVAFPNRTGIIFASNRPDPRSPNTDTVIAGRSRYNIYLIDNFSQNVELRQLSKLTDMRYGNARFPMQYNNSHFTFVSDETGVQNRWAGFFSTARNGLDTLYYIGDEILRNPSITEFDSTLNAWQKQEPDSVSFFQVFKDSTYSFPMTNYATNLLETRISGDKGTVSETRQEGTFKYLYKLKVDSATLRKRNVNPKNTNYRAKMIAEQRGQTGAAIDMKTGVPIGTTNLDTVPKKPTAVFQNEFEDENPDSLARVQQEQQRAEAYERQQVKGALLRNSKLFKYRYQFSAEMLQTGITNNVLVNRYQPYQGGAGPIRLANGNDLSWTLRAGVADLMEDVRIMGGGRFGAGNLGDKELFMSVQNFRRRVDWGFTYYRSNINDFRNFFSGSRALFSNNVITSIYQANVGYPLNEVKSLRALVGMRLDRGIIKPVNLFGNADPSGLPEPDSTTSTLVSRLEYVHDNTLNPAQNIWKGLRWKLYVDANIPMSRGSSIRGNTTYVVGGDARYYLPIYRNFIWATRLSADFSFGRAKMIYFLGGMDGWISPRFNDNRPDPRQNYAFQSLAVNLRGFNQNIANGNNAMVFNSELRFPVFSTLFNKPINNAFLRNLQITQFFDLGTAWTEKFANIKRPSIVDRDQENVNPVQVRFKAGGIGPLAGGYGFGARSMLLGYFLKSDLAWQMNGLFRGRPIFYFSVGLDF